MADEQTKPPFNKPATIPKELDWQKLPGILRPDKTLAKEVVTV